MSQADQSRRVYYFTHIPKAAGTSFIRMLERQFPPAARHVIHPNPFRFQQSVRQYCDMPEEGRRRIRCVMGHAPFGLHRWCPGGMEPVYLTVVRQPLARAISQYLYIQDHPRIIEWVGLPPKAMQSLEAYLDAERELGMNNLQTRLLSGVEDVAAFRPPYPPLAEGSLDLARRNVERFYPVVGLLERFEDTLVLMRRRFGWDKLMGLRVNVTSSRGGDGRFTEAILRRIEADNALDLALYEWCSARLAAAVEADGRHFLRERRRLRRGRAIRRLMRGIVGSGPRRFAALLDRLRK